MKSYGANRWASIDGVREQYAGLGSWAWAGPWVTASSGRIGTSRMKVPYGCRTTNVVPEAISISTRSYITLHTSFTNHVLELYTLISSNNNTIRSIIRSAPNLILLPMLRRTSVSGGLLLRRVAADHV